MSLVILRSCLFLLLFFMTVAPLTLLFSFFYFMPREGTIVFAHYWSLLILKVLKVTTGLTYEIRGKVPEGAVIVASKHQSAWETFAYNVILKRPTYVLKKELLKVPFFGWGLKKMGVIAINRKDGRGSLKQLVKESEYFLNDHRPIVIFPEGTRQAYGADSRYNVGIAFLYDHAKVPVVPVALNSGRFWSRRSLHKFPGKIIVEFLEPIAPGLPKDDFMTLLKERIETKMKEI